MTKLNPLTSRSAWQSQSTPALESPTHCNLSLLVLAWSAHTMAHFGFVSTNRAMPSRGRWAKLLLTAMAALTRDHMAEEGYESRLSSAQRRVFVSWFVGWFLTSCATRLLTPLASIHSPALQQRTSSDILTARYSRETTRDAIEAQINPKSRKRRQTILIVG